MNVISKFAIGKWLPFLLVQQRIPNSFLEKEKQPASLWSCTGLQFGRPPQVILFQQRLAGKHKGNPRIIKALIIGFLSLQNTRILRPLRGFITHEDEFIFYYSFVLFYSWKFSKHDALLSKSLAGRKQDNGAGSLCSSTDLHQLGIIPFYCPGTECSCFILIWFQFQKLNRLTKWMFASESKPITLKLFNC